MKFIVKFFPEITIKSRPVRKQLVKLLRDNLRAQIKPVDPEIEIQRDWDKLVIETRLADATPVIDILQRTSGIAHFLDVQEFPFVDLDDAYQKTLALWGERLRGKTFAVRVKRAGNHPFTSTEAEQYIGGGLNQNSGARGVDLKTPDETVRLEIRDDKLFIVNRRYPGIGGYPVGGQDSVLALMSGGFDSTVAAFLTMRRGMRTHFVFFNLGGREHELGVKEVAHYLWSHYGAASRVKFITVPFEHVVAEILKNVDDSHMGVILKRMMLRAAERFAAQFDAKALVTGESVAQVSSQTLMNLSAIDRVTEMLVLRPLITMGKGEIIQLATEIGTEPFAAHMPEYCGVISVKPTTRAKLPRVEYEEGKFDFAVLEQAIAAARIQNIDEVANDEASAPVDVLVAPITGSIVIDVRHPTEAERKPLRAGNVAIEKIPFYELQTRAAEFDRGKTYLLYCEKGVMSKLHAAHLLEQGYTNIKVYRPA